MLRLIIIKLLPVREQRIIAEIDNRGGIISELPSVCFTYPLITIKRKTY